MLPGPTRCLIASFLLAALAAASPADEPSPRYRGKTLEEWLPAILKKPRFADEGPQEEVRIALQYFGARAVPLLTDRLRGPDARERQAAARALVDLDVEAAAAAPALTRALADAEVRPAAVEAL